MVESFEIIKKPKRICRGRGRGRRGRGGRRLHPSEAGDDVFSLEFCSSDDVLIEILTRLPLKSIFRFKCVSKRWHQLISKDHFRFKVIERNKMDLGPLYFFQTPVMSDRYSKITEEYSSGRHPWSFLVEAATNSGNNYKFGERVEGEGEVEVDYSSSSPSDHVISSRGNRNNGGGDDFRFFICSSNGLLLCLVSHWIQSPPPWSSLDPDSSISYCHRYYQHVKRYYIYNPLTKLGYLLPYSPKQTQRHCKSHTTMSECQFIGRDCVALVEGSSSSSSSSADFMRRRVGYKVVRAEASLSNSNIIELETFSSHTGEWRLSTVTVTADTHKNFSIFAPWNFSVRVIKGAIYWMVGCTCFLCIFVYSPPHDDDDDENTGGTIEMIKAPTDGYGYNFQSDVGVGESVDGLLQVATVNRFAKDGCFIKIWVYNHHHHHPQEEEMEEEEDYSRWLLVRQVPLPTKFKSVGASDERTLISFHPLDPNILFVRGCCGWIFACHLNTTTTPMLVEPSVRFNLLHKYVTVQPYLPPPWPISPFPDAVASALKK